MFLAEEERRFREIVKKMDRWKANPLCATGSIESIMWLGDHGYKFTHGDMELASQKGRLDIVQVMVKKYNCSSPYWVAETLRTGQLEVASWLMKNGIHWLEGDVMARACYAKLPGTFEWLRDNIVGPLSPRLMDIAAMLGNLEVIKDMRKEGYPFTIEARAYARGGGHEETAAWLKENGRP